MFFLRYKPWPPVRRRRASNVLIRFSGSCSLTINIHAGPWLPLPRNLHLTFAFLLSHPHNQFISFFGLLLLSHIYYLIFSLRATLH